ncbi:hypothetical protein IKG12_00555 [Candidatus Saccharibacteria bacterium]|nr:hypothetical protein [Candidatus Saccharibacteria bacterium]
MKNSLFNEDTLQKIQKTRKIFLKFAVWILIAELVLGAVLILTGSWDVAIGRIQGTFLILALILFVSVNNFIRIEKGNKTIQIFALIGFVSNLIWGIFAFLLMWEIVPFHWTEEIMRTSSYSGYSYPSTKYHMTFYATIMLITSYAAAAGFWISNILSIKETIKLVKPLKITAVVCVAYLWIFGTIITPIEPEFKNVEKLYQLAGLAGLAFGITALAALIISKTNKKKVAESNTTMNGVSTQFTPKTEAELRAEIEEKVRREMIEKEVRAKMEAEKPTIANPSTDNIEDTSDKKESPEPTQSSVA